VTDRGELKTLLDDAAAEVADVTVTTDDGDRHSWSRNDAVFAVLAGDAVDLRIGAVIADAAVRTPDTRRSSRGPEWVTFAPSELDDHALDRLEAWFAAAWRRAAPGE